MALVTSVRRLSQSIEISGSGMQIKLLDNVAYDLSKESEISSSAQTTVDITMPLMA